MDKGGFSASRPLVVCDTEEPMRKTLLILLPVALIALSAPQSASAMPIDGSVSKAVPAVETVTYYGYGYGYGYGYNYYPRYRHYNYAPKYYYNYGYKPYYYNYYPVQRFHYYPRRHYYRW